MDFSTTLLQWYGDHARELPWKADKDPYKIWVSEIILQQTRVEQAKSYYLRFLQAFPSVQDLADAPETAVLRLWQGLGYYSRARNMHKAAKTISDIIRKTGSFPATSAALCRLPGIGPYTAAAIASFAFAENTPAMDGNVYRILTRYFNLPLFIDNPAHAARIRNLAAGLIPPGQSPSWNQAMMDFGSLVCTPQPHCETCPLAGGCGSLMADTIAERPLHKPKAAPRDRWFFYWDAHIGDTRFLRQRTGRDIWQGLYEFPLIERDSPSDPDVLFADPSFTRWFPAGTFVAGTPRHYTHKLTHQTIHACFLPLEVHQAASALLSEFQSVSPKALDLFPLSRLTEKYLESLSS